VTRDFFVQPAPREAGRVTAVKLAYVVHVDERSVPSRHEYIFMDGSHFDNPGEQTRRLDARWATPNGWRTYEADPALLQRDVDWLNRHFESLGVTPKFTRGQPTHPFHPKRYIHDMIDATIARKASAPARHVTIKVCVDCVDDTDFVNHLLYAAARGVWVQVQVDWRKMVLTHSDNYVRLKRSGIELLGVFCTPRDGRIEVAPDMHNKFIIFDDRDAIVGSFNIGWERWGANWESGLTFHSQGVARLLDDVFQSIRGGMIRRYGVDPLSHFNLLYTFGRQTLLDGRCYRPNHAVLSAIHRARRSVRVCLFLLGEMAGEHGDSVVDALIEAWHRGVETQVLVNGHLARCGDPGAPCSMDEELAKPLVPAVARLRGAGVPVRLAYGWHAGRVPYCPLHTKYAIVDEQTVLDGSLNWYNTSLFSHDLYVVASHPALAQAYLHEWWDTVRSLRLVS
jgi:phosphatidylserine/phosphatidylglycerophosphate/cardiolipin synthase-like enzyme